MVELRANGKKVTGPPPVTRSGELWVPVSSLLEALGFKVSWDDDKARVYKSFGYSTEYH
ncbi:MAG: stalk domain-containing protein [Desulfitobacteriaceae bacterium]